MLKPLGDRVIIEAQEAKEETVGGIVLANNAKEKPQTGKVVAVGNGRVLDNGQTVAPEVKKGDEVVYDKYAGTSVDYDGQKYLVLKESDILAVVE
ncbi:co-chaperone GroES [Apilactobacillus kunkeei]|uniref:co-chaperone GroES n=1 Tax=Apilactobacillus kunkeei TaxID=148814 RepID=UPI00110CAE8B|nr:co-chaperone GroES [Apilactobacillus kunkeei]TMT00646.1 co-chaperone GroES [Apilactobacillus kunkeei]